MTIMLGADDRAIFYTDEQQRYVIGDPDRPLLTLNAVDEYGVMWACAEPEGWDAPAVVTPAEPRQGGHGVFLSESYYEQRALAFTGSFAAPTLAEARRARERLRSAVLSNLVGLVPYWHLDDEPAKHLLVRPSGQPRIALDGRWCDYAFVLVAEDPIKRGVTREYGPMRLPGATGATGRSYPRPGAWSYDQLVGAPFADNAGDEDAHARYIITGPVAQPLVEVGADEQWFALATDLAAATPTTPADVAIVDTDAGTVEVNGELRFDLWVTGSTFPLVPPGGAVTRLRSRADDRNQIGRMTVVTAPAWK